MKWPACAAVLTDAADEACIALPMSTCDKETVLRLSDPSDMDQDKYPECKRRRASKIGEPAKRWVQCAPSSDSRACSVESTVTPIAGTYLPP